MSTLCGLADSGCRIRAGVAGWYDLVLVEVVNLSGRPPDRVDRTLRHLREVVRPVGIGLRRARSMGLHAYLIV